MHFRILGFWRVLAAFLVMIFHYLSYGPASAQEFAERMRSLMPLLDMFLMISGFLIMLRYADRLLVERGGYVNFLVRRLARFYPLYLLTLGYFVLVGLALQFTQGDAADSGRYDFSTLPANLLLVQGWGFTEVLTFNYVGWTLSAEWFCYLTLPVVVLAHRHFGLAGLAALIVATCFALEAAVVTGMMPVDNWMAADTWGAYRAFADFTIGAFVAVLVKDSRWRLRSHVPGWSVFAMGIVLMWNGLGGYAALALLAAAIFLAAVAERNNQDGTLVLKPFDPLAGASFSIYLVHPVAASLMLGVLWRRIIEPLGIVDFYLYWLAPMAVSVVLALLSARYFETPVARMLNDRLANGGAAGIASRTA